MSNLRVHVHRPAAKTPLVVSRAYVWFLLFALLHFMYREHPELFNADLTNVIEFWNRQKTTKKGTQQ